MVFSIQRALRSGLFLILFFLLSTRAGLANYTPGPGYRYLGCDTSKGKCNVYSQLTGDSTEMCGTGWKAVCGFDKDGYSVSGAPDLCSCVKLAAGEQPPVKKNTGCTCEKDPVNPKKYNVKSSNCSSSTPAQCHDPQFTYPGLECDCLASGVIQPLPGTPVDVTSPTANPFAGCESKPNSINTALGCIPVDMGDFMTWLLPFLFRIAGGISFLLMVYGFILITLSKGDPKKVQGAKETITSAITGLLLSIFGLFILRLIVTGILKLPGVN